MTHYAAGITCLKWGSFNENGDRGPACFDWSWQHDVPASLKSCRRFYRSCEIQYDKSAFQIFSLAASLNFSILCCLGCCPEEITRLNLQSVVSHHASSVNISSSLLSVHRIFLCPFLKCPIIWGGSTHIRFFYLCIHHNYTLSIFCFKLLE